MAILKRTLGILLFVVAPALADIMPSLTFEINGGSAGFSPVLPDEFFVQLGYVGPKMPDRVTGNSSVPLNPGESGTVYIEDQLTQLQVIGTDATHWYLENESGTFFFESGLNFYNYPPF